MPARGFELETGILVVDDSEMTRQLNLKILARMGYSSLHEAENGQKALDLIVEKGQEIGLILSDQKMPDMNGSELLESLRQDEKTASLPFLLISAINTDSKLLKTLEGENVGFLKKPYKPNELAKAMQELHEKLAS